MTLVRASFRLVLTIGSSLLLGPGCHDTGGKGAAVNGSTVDAAALEAGATASWVCAVQGAIEQQEYHASVTEAGLQAPNRAQNLRTCFRSDGIEVVPRAVRDDSPSWRFRWRTMRWGRDGDRQVDVAYFGAGPCFTGPRVSYRFAGLTEWYENRKEGIEQGFTIETRPRGDGPLRISGLLAGDLRANHDIHEDFIDFFDAAGSRVLRYGGLIVTDAQEQQVPARLDLVGEELTIVIEDDGASYPLTVDPLLTSPSWMAEGDRESAYFGYCVATAGDVDGDGCSDVVIGAMRYDNGESAEGRAFLYHGSPAGLESTPAWSAEGDQMGAAFGSSVASAGDVNADGYDDVIVGATSYDNGEADEGRVFVYHGSMDGLAAIPAWTVEGNQVDAALGRSSSAGDVNGDGFGDVILGAVAFDNGQTNEGRAFVYHGSPAGLASVPSWTAEGDQADAGFGLSVATAGDVDGDGYADVIVGASGHDNGQNNEGRAYVYHGSPGGLSPVADWVAESNQASSSFGHRVAAAGDVNGDGYADVIVSAHQYDGGHNNEGRAFLYHGSASGLSSAPDWTAESNQAECLFGQAVATAGDVNGDGFADVIVGADYYDNGENNEGRAFVYLGSAAGLGPLADWTSESDQASSRFGYSVATAGDVDGDGYSDVIVGAHFFDNGQSQEGIAVVYRGSASGQPSPVAWTVAGNQAGAEYGWSSTAGDVNGDGYSDVIVSAWYYDAGETDEGRAYVYHGSPEGLSQAPAWMVDGDHDYAHFGSDVATAGDVNGDGYSDVIVGASGYRNGQSEEGRAYVYHGSPEGLSQAPAWMVDGDHDYAHFGSDVATAGDVNGDGYSDVVVGAPHLSNGQSAEGRVYVYHGSQDGLSMTPSWTAEPDLGNAHFGHSVESAGDVNGDGYSDLVIGAPNWSNPETREGLAFVYYGSAAGLASTPAWTAEGDQAESRFGGAVTAGDVNGDGYSDVLVSASWFDNPDYNEGKVFCYLGSAGGLPPSAAWTTEGDDTNRNLGGLLGAAGDVNADGYSDVLISALDETVDGWIGEARLFLGSSDGLPSGPAWTWTGTQSSDWFGSAATAGDVNGDGYSDMVIGALAHDGDLTDEGAAYLYYGNQGDGLDRTPMQVRTDGNTPIWALGIANAPDGFGLRALGRTAAGRARVRLECEVKPFGTPFDGTGLIAGPLFDTGSPSESGSSVALSQQATGLTGGTLYRWRVRVSSSSPQFPRTPWCSLPYNALMEADVRTAEGASEVAGDPLGPMRGLLREVAPNPARGPVRVAFDVSESGDVRLCIHDAAGREVACLVDEPMESGTHEATWTGADGGGKEVALGVYFVRITVAGRTETRKITQLP